MYYWVSMLPEHREIPIHNGTGILVLTACALILDRIVTEAEKRLMRWQPTV